MFKLLVSSSLGERKKDKIKEKKNQTGNTFIAYIHFAQCALELENSSSKYIQTLI